VDIEKGYWHRQFYFLSSLGLFYIIIIALFAVPLLGTFVVILIKGALDLRYFIIAGGCVALTALIVYAIRAFRRLRRRIQRDAFAAREDIRRNQLMGNPIEVSLCNGLLKLSFGQTQASGRPSLPHHGVALLPQQTAGDAVADVVDQLHCLSELKRNGTISTDEFNQLKARLFASSTAPCVTAEPDLS
jgi:hypothetical protein